MDNLSLNLQRTRRQMGNIFRLILVVLLNVNKMDLIYELIFLECLGPILIKEINIHIVKTTFLRHRL